MDFSREPIIIVAIILLLITAPYSIQPYAWHAACMGLIYFYYNNH